MSNWSVAGEKNKTRRRKAKQNKRSQMPIPLNVDDWTDRLSSLDQAIYTIFQTNHPIKLSPENVLFQLCKVSTHAGATIKQVWASLDSTCMKRYITRTSHTDWGLVTTTTTASAEVCILLSSSILTRSCSS